MATKIVSQEFCRSCDKKTAQGLIVQGEYFTVRQCIECRTVRTYEKTRSVS